MSLENNDYNDGIVGNIDGTTIKDNTLSFTALKDGMMKLEFEFGIADAGTINIFEKYLTDKLILARGHIELTEVPDSSTKTITAIITDGSDAATDTLTFTEGTETVGTIKSFTPTANNVFIEDETIKVTIGGTSTTLGKVKGLLIFDRM